MYSNKKLVIFFVLLMFAITSYGFVKYDKMDIKEFDGDYLNIYNNFYNEMDIIHKSYIFDISTNYFGKVSALSFQDRVFISSEYKYEMTFSPQSDISTISDVSYRNRGRDFPLSTDSENYNLHFYKRISPKNYAYFSLRAYDKKEAAKDLTDMAFYYNYSDKKNEVAFLWRKHSYDTSTLQDTLFLHNYQNFQAKYQRKLTDDISGKVILDNLSENGDFEKSDYGVKVAFDYEKDMRKLGVAFSSVKYDSDLPMNIFEKEYAFDSAYTDQLFILRYSLKGEEKEEAYKMRNNGYFGIKQNFLNTKNIFYAGYFYNRFYGIEYFQAGIDISYNPNIDIELKPYFRALDIDKDTGNFNEDDKKYFGCTGKLSKKVADIDWDLDFYFNSIELENYSDIGAKFQQSYEKYFLQKKLFFTIFLGENFYHIDENWKFNADAGLLFRVKDVSFKFQLTNIFNEQYYYEDEREISGYFNFELNWIFYN